MLLTVSIRFLELENGISKGYQQNYEFNAKRHLSELLLKNLFLQFSGKLHCAQ